MHDEVQFIDSFLCQMALCNSYDGFQLPAQSGVGRPTRFRISCDCESVKQFQQNMAGKLAAEAGSWLDEIQNQLLVARCTATSSKCIAISSKKLLD